MPARIEGVFRRFSGISVTFFRGSGTAAQAADTSASKKSDRVTLLAGAILLLVIMGTAGGVYTSFFMDDDPCASISFPTDGAVFRALDEFATPENFSGQGAGDGIGELPLILTTGEPVEYIVSSGDTLSEIAYKNNVGVGTLIGFNKITNVYRLMPGTMLKIPNIDGIPYTVKPGDTLITISQKHGIPLNHILDANHLESDVLNPGETLFIPGASISDYDLKKAMGTLFVYPLTRASVVTSGYGYRADPFTGVRRMHYGVDFANRIGTPIYASREGRVIGTGDNPKGFGKYVVIKHSNGFQTVYAHLNVISVRTGQWLDQGQKLGELGNSGRSTGPHLHFAIYKNNIPIDPYGGYLY